MDKVQKLLKKIMNNDKCEPKELALQALAVMEKRLEMNMPELAVTE